MHLLVARWGLIGLIHFAPPELPVVEETTMQLPVLLFAFAVSLAVAAGLGLFSVLRATAGDVQKALVEQGRSQTGSRRSQRLGRAIIAGQLGEGAAIRSIEPDYEARLRKASMSAMTWLRRRAMTRTAPTRSGAAPCDSPPCAAWC